MDEIRTTEAIDQHRRRFFGTAALTVAAAQFGMIGPSGAQAQPGRAAGDQAGDEHVVRPAEAGRRRPPQCRLR